MISRELLNKNKLQLDRMGNIHRNVKYIVFIIMYGQKIPMFSHDDKKLCELYITQYKICNDEYSLIIK